MTEEERIEILESKVLLLEHKIGQMIFGRLISDKSDAQPTVTSEELDSLMEEWRKQ